LEGTIPTEIAASHYLRNLYAEGCREGRTERERQLVGKERGEGEKTDERRRGREST
jgi:hypothetical protein